MDSVIAFAEGCSEADWTTVCANEERTVGVLLDHIAAGNREVQAWIRSFLAGQPVAITPERLNAENAEHARRAAGRPRLDTIDDLRESGRQTAEFLAGLSSEQLEVRQSFGWAGEQNVEWVAQAALRHPTRHLASIREALGR